MIKLKDADTQILINFIRFQNMSITLSMNSNVTIFPQNYNKDCNNFH